MIRHTAKATLFVLSLALLAASPRPSFGQTQDIALPSPGFRVQKYSPDLDRPFRNARSRYGGPLIDTHTHVVSGSRRVTMRLRDVINEVKEAGVERLIVLPTPNEAIFREKAKNAQLRRDIVSNKDVQAVELCGSTELTRWMHDAYRKGFEESDLKERLARLKRDIEGGICKGIGEIGPYHFDKQQGQAEIEFPVNFRPFLALAALAAELDVPFDVHAEPLTPEGRSYEEQVFGGVALLYKLYPNLKLILAHTGMTSTDNARALLRTYPKLMMNLKAVIPGRKLRWENLGPLVNSNGELFEDWALLLEEIPGRFMIGSDARFLSPQYPSGHYAHVIERLRLILGRLNENAAQRIAYENPSRYFDWRSKPQNKP